MNFKEMKQGCPWMEGGPYHDDPHLSVPETCVCAGWPCEDYTCAPYHWVKELKRDLENENREQNDSTKPP